MAQGRQLKPRVPQDNVGQDFIKPSAIQMAQEKDESTENAAGTDVQKKAGSVNNAKSAIQPNAVAQAKQEQQQNAPAEKEADEVADKVTEGAEKEVDTDGTKVGRKQHKKRVNPLLNYSFTETRHAPLQ